MLMRTRTLTSEEGELIGFEISNSFVSSRSTAAYIRRVPGCDVLDIRKLFSRNEVHVRFAFAGKTFIVWEPFGDNSRLWIGPDDGESVSVDLLVALKVKIDDTSRWRILS